MADDQGVLLYYKFVTLPNPEKVRHWFQDLCTSLSLLGRVRISPSGINVTVGGSMKSLNSHIKAVEQHELFQGCDFKLAPCTRPVDTTVASTCGFDSLSVRLVEEIVTLGVYPSPSLQNAGKHLSPREFHDMLDEGSQQDKMVVLDARNIYETRIGKFNPPAGVGILDPKIRQYSDLPGWIDENIDQLRDKSILMYCTGGVRCEMASAYIRNKGDGFENVFQLSGGIQRYLEAFPDGGYFQGKNFVFDHRISVPSSRAVTVGRCITCGSEYDDYTSRTRCSICRMLVLVCPSCQATTTYVCELCKGADEKERTLPEKSGSKLRILCLHGFRQNASNMKGRLGSLIKKLKRTAEFVFVDAPHELPFVYQPRKQEEDQETVVPQETPKRKFAWLVDPNSPELLEGTVVPSFDPMQYKSQTSGWEESLKHLEAVFSTSGSFDGVLGFSQGAAVAAALATTHRGGEGNNNNLRFKFVILCSGFVPPVVEQTEALIDCSSLHIYCGDGGNDRQIGCLESERLVKMFSPSNRMVVRHMSGHMVPTAPEYLEQYLTFLQQFM